MTFLELQVAFVLLGIALAGLGPLVVMQWRLTRRLEARTRPFQTYHSDPSGAWTVDTASPRVVYYVVPLPEPWARQFANSAPAPVGGGFTYAPARTTPPLIPAASVQVVNLAYTPSLGSVAAEVARTGP
jgi:hypothetical protein